MKRGEWRLEVTPANEQLATTHKLEKYYKEQLTLHNDAIRGLIRDQTATKEGGATANATTTKTGIQFQPFIQGERGPCDHLEYLTLDNTRDMTTLQIRQWVILRQKIEQDKIETNRRELREVAMSLRNALFGIIREILPDEAKDQEKRARIGVKLRYTLEHINKLPGIG